MSRPKRLWRVGLEGSSTLLGKEILAVLKARRFPVTQVLGLEDRSQPPEAPVLDIAADGIPVVQASGEERAECDFVFRAGRSVVAAEKPEPVDGPDRAGETGPSQRGFVIDVGSDSEPSSVLSLPLFNAADQPSTPALEKGIRHFACPHAATSVVSGLAMRLAASTGLRHMFAVFFLSASELGPDAIDELQKQTIGLLNFGDVPRKVFGAQIAFNLSPRLTGKAKSRMAAAESRIRSELERLLVGWVTVPPVQLIQSPSFYSMAFSIYIQSPERASANEIQHALSGENVRWVRPAQPSATPGEVQGSPALLLDPIVEASNQAGFWLWGRVDDLRLQAENAVAIAEHLMPVVDR